MAANKAVWGIDLGQSALKAIRLRPGDDRVEATDHVYIEHSKILSAPDVDARQIVDESMEKFLSNHDLGKETLAVAVPGQNTLARFTKLPPVDKKKIPEIVKYEAQQQIPFDMAEVIWDYQTFGAGDAPELDVGIFAMRRDLMREHLRFLSGRNLEPAIVQSSPLALYNALVYDGMCGAEPVAILDIGTRNTDLLVVDGESLWSRNIPIGGNNFTEVLLKTFKLSSFSRAEKLKRGASSHKHARQIFQAMRPVFADLVAEIQRSIGFYTSSKRGIRLNKVLGMGNAFKLPGLPKFIQQNLGMEVVRPTTFSRLSASEAANAPQLMDQLLSYGVAYGLALQGLGLSTINTSLLPPEIAKQVIWRRKMPWFYGAAACFVASAVMVWGRDLSDRGALEDAGKPGTSPPTFSSVEQASRIIEDGPSTSLPPKDYALQILGAARYMNSQKSEAQSAKEKLAQQAESVAELQADKVLIPQLLQAIHAALPAPDPELARAMEEGPEAYRNLVESNPDKYERPQRRQVFIRRLEMDFSKDVMASYKSIPGLTGRGKIDDDGDRGRGRGRGRGRRPAAPDQPKEGFLVTLIGRTPFAGGDYARGYPFINDTIMGNLLKGGQGQDGFYFDHLHLVRADPLRVLERGGSSGRSGAGAGGMFGESAGEKSVATISTAAEDLDPVTGESIMNDWEFEIVFVAMLGEPPLPESQEEGTDGFEGSRGDRRGARR